MIAEHLFSMWQGMRRAGTLGPDERFTVAEIGAGNGVMAESVLDYIDQQAKAGKREGWPEFASQVLYICYDRSPALNKTQRERNARFGRMFDAREADATNLAASIAPESVKGVVLSNELPDAFSVHKVALSAEGGAEVAFVVPSLPAESWARVKKGLPAAVVEAVAEGDRDVRKRFFEDRVEDPGTAVYLTRRSFTELLEAVTSTDESVALVRSLQFQEVYVPARLIPELASHLRRYAAHYAAELAATGQGIVTYVNLGSESFIQGAARILKAGYVITLDYGTNWEGLLSRSSTPHLRTYGPARQELSWNNYEYAWGDGPNDWQDTSDPYDRPTLNDLTTDVNFSLLAAAGQLAGLKHLYYGPQAALRTGTGIQFPEGESYEFNRWASTFETDANYRLMVQQKEGTDPQYTYPATNPDSLFGDASQWTEERRTKAAAIEKSLAAGLAR
jgi:SAM-dependent MidA family methyltransferase